MTSAAESTVIGKLKDLTKCCICQKVLTDSRSLPCYHAFCLKCLIDYQSKFQKNVKRPGDKMLCPHCREGFTIPPSGMTDLRKDFFIENLLEIVRMSATDGKEKLCDVCQANHEELLPHATRHCVECRESMCDRCSNEHQRHKLGRAHKVIAFGTHLEEDLTNEDILRNYPVTTCTEHEDKQLELYCNDCKEVVCFMCFVENHKQHDCTDVKKMEKIFRKEIRYDDDMLMMLREECFNKKKEIQKIKTDLLRNIGNVEQEIIDQNRKLKAMIEKHTQFLQTKLVSLKAKQLKVISKEIDHIEGHIATIESFKAYVDQIQVKGSSTVICKVAADLSVRAEDIRSSLNDNLNKTFRLARLTLKNSQQFSNSKNVIGELKDEPETIRYQPLVCYPIQVLVSLGVSTKTIPMNQTDSVDRLLTNIGIEFNLEEEQFYLMHNGEYLENGRGRSLHQAGIHHLSHVVIMIRVLGG